MFVKYANSPSDKPEGNMNKNTILEINSCGTYRLYSQKVLPTFRSSGRIDYQLIYIASGKGYGIDPTHHTILSGTNPDYAHLFEMIIWELQLQKDFYQESAVLYFKQLLISLGRFDHKDSLNMKSSISTEIEQDAAYFHEHYRENINIEEYVESLCLSNSLFFRKFKLYTGMTPLQYLLDIRLSNAKKLLETTDYSINEIASIIGYDNALYFSRLFHKHIGMSPKEYRNSLQ